MGKLIYLLNVSLDGYVETPTHGLDWPIVDEELHRWFNEHMRAMDASLYGSRMYELMSAYWPTAQDDPKATPAMREFGALWLETPRIVFSSSLAEVGFNSRLVRGSPAEELAKLRSEFAGDLEVAGATLAASFVRAGLVDEYRLVVHPVAIGAGTRFFPELDSPLSLTLVETRTFESGVVYLRYASA